jgi:hypothetical protein
VQEENKGETAEVESNGKEEVKDGGDGNGDGGDDSEATEDEEAASREADPEYMEEVSSGSEGGEAVLDPNVRRGVRKRVNRITKVGEHNVLKENNYTLEAGEGSIFDREVLSAI